MGTLSKISTAAGILVMLIPAAVHIIWPPSAVCLEACGLALVYLGRRTCGRRPSGIRSCGSTRRRPGQKE